MAKKKAAFSSQISDETASKVKEAITDNEAQAMLDIMVHTRKFVRQIGILPAMWILALINELAEMTILQANDEGSALALEAVLKALRFAYDDILNDIQNGRMSKVKLTDNAREARANPHVASETDDEEQTRKEIKSILSEADALIERTMGKLR
jgi:hypothetical protein